MALALASFWQRAAIAGVGLLALGACESDLVAEAPPSTAPITDRPIRVSNELARGQQALSAGDLQAAQAAFTAALRGSPNDPEPAIGLAETYLALGDIETAKRLLDLVAATESGAENARLLQGRGFVALRQGDTELAVRLLEQSVDRDPGQWRAWAGLGRAYGRLGRSRQARAAFARAEDAAPIRALVINDIGMLHLEENDPAAALEAFQRALAVDPDNAMANANARIARAMLGDYEAAVSGARPEELPDVLNNVGYIAIVNGDFEVADRLLRRAVEISPVYHEPASANLELLAQAMKGVPVLALAGRGVSTPQPTEGTELSSVSGGAAVRGEAGAEVEMDGPAERALSDWQALAMSAVQASEESAGTTSVAGTVPAAEVSAAKPATLAHAHGFQWESPPVSRVAKTNRKRGSRKPARPAAAADDATDGDPRKAAWPTINPPAAVATLDVAAEPAPDGAGPPAEPRIRSGASEDIRDAARSSADPRQDATRAARRDEPASEPPAEPQAAAVKPATMPKQPGLPE